MSFCHLCLPDLLLKGRGGGLSHPLLLEICSGECRAWVLAPWPAGGRQAWALGRKKRAGLQMIGRGLYPQVPTPAGSNPSPHSSASLGSPSPHPRTPFPIPTLRAPLLCLGCCWRWPALGTSWSRGQTSRVHLVNTVFCSGWPLTSESPGLGLQG